MEKIRHQDLQEILENHIKWLRAELGGLRADLTGAVLTRADLTGADLTGAVLGDANLTGAVLRDADLTGAVLGDANLTGAVLTRADLTGADLTGAVLRGAVLGDANLSGVKGLNNAKDYLRQFERTKNGIYVYKAFGAYKQAPDYWRIEPKSYIEEVVNPDHGTDCGSGVNFATMEWLKCNSETKDLPVWKCLIHWEDMADVIVPFGTDGKARCARLQLIEVVDA